MAPRHFGRQAPIMGVERPTAVVFTTITQAIGQALLAHQTYTGDTSEVNLETYKFASVNTNLTAATIILEGKIGFTNVNFEAADDDRPIDLVTQKRGIFKGFATLLSIAKPITAANQKYLESRWNAFVASRPADRLPPFNEMMPQGTMNEFDIEIAMRASGYISPLSVVQSLTNDTAEDNYTRNLRDQLRLVWKGAGMTSVELMTKMISAKDTLIFANAVILEEAVRYKRLVDRIKAEHGDEFDYLRIIQPSALEPLNAREFADIYYAATKLAGPEHRKELTATFQVSTHPTKVPKNVIDQLIKIRLDDLGAVTRDMHANLQTLGIDPAVLTATLSRRQRRRHRRRNSSSESDDD